MALHLHLRSGRYEKPGTAILLARWDELPSRDHEESGFATGC
jgi:hypothetical protein